MRRALSKDLTLYFSPLFPRRFAGVRRRWALIGVGGNLGEVMRRFKKVASILAVHPRVRLVRTAPVLKNPPFGYTKQPEFFNTIFLVDTALAPKRLLRFLFWLERRFGRERSFKNAPRTLDLDILFYECRRIRSKELVVPHPFWRERDSVIIPLKYVGAKRCAMLR